MEVLSVITGIFKFWDQIVWLIKKLEKTPEEKRQALMVTVNNAFDERQNGGRPGEI